MGRIWQAGDVRATSVSQLTMDYEPLRYGMLQVRAAVQGAAEISRVATADCGTGATPQPVAQTRPSAYASNRLLDSSLRTL
ncbi:unnamed protein product [Colias eurytheme]|nr:unnamed protein product [Colias eurytheme]